MTKPKRKGKLRTHLKKRGKKLYAMRERFSPVENIQSIGRSFRRDRAINTKFKVKPRQASDRDQQRVRKLGKR